MDTKTRDKYFTSNRKLFLTNNYQYFPNFHKDNFLYSKI